MKLSKQELEGRWLALVCPLISRKRPTLNYSSYVLFSDKALEMSSGVTALLQV